MGASAFHAHMRIFAMSEAAFLPVSVVKHICDGNLEGFDAVRAAGSCLTGGMSGANAHSFDAWCSLRQ